MEGLAAWFYNCNKNLDRVTAIQAHPLVESLIRLQNGASIGDDAALPEMREKLQNSGQHS